MGQTRVHLSLVVVAVTFVAGSALSTAPTPLYPVYESLLGVTTVGITLIFSMFAVGAVAGLLIFAPAVGRFGNRALFGAAAAVQSIAGFVLALSPSVVGFGAGRILAGIGVGMLASSVTATIRQLAASGSPSAFSLWAVKVSPALSMAGLALGPLAAGALSPSSPSTLATFYLSFAVILAVGSLGASVLPAVGGAGIAAPAPARVPSSSLVGAFLAFATTGLFGALAPALIQRIDAASGPAGIGTTVGLIFAAGAVAPLVCGAFLRVMTTEVGATTLLVGLLGVASALSLSSHWLFLASGTVAGAGSGLVFAVALRRALASVPASEAARAASLTFASAYVGLALPVISAGLLLDALSPTTVALVFAIGMAAITAVAVSLGRRGRPGVA